MLFKKNNKDYKFFVHFIVCLRGTNASSGVTLGTPFHLSNIKMTDTYSIKKSNISIKMVALVNFLLCNETLTGTNLFQENIFLLEVECCKTG